MTCHVLINKVNLIQLFSWMVHTKFNSFLVQRQQSKMILLSIITPRLGKSVSRSSQTLTITIAVVITHGKMKVVTMPTKTYEQM